MKIVSSFKHLEHTPSIDEKINKKSQKLKKYFDGNFEVHWTCSIKEDGQQMAEIKLVGAAFDYHASAFSDSLYKSLDLVIAKVEKQIAKKKEIRRGKISHKHKESFKDQQIGESLSSEDYWEDRNIDEVAS